MAKVHIVQINKKIIKNIKQAIRIEKIQVSYLVQLVFNLNI